MNFKKLSFLVLIIFAFFMFSSFYVSANFPDRSLPTIYKITGDVNISSQTNRNVAVVAVVDVDGGNYPIGISSITCKDYDNFKNILSTGFFAGPINPNIVSLSQKSISLKISVLTGSNCINNISNINSAINANIYEGEIN